MADPIIKKNSAKFDTAHNIETHADIANKTAEVFNLVTGEQYSGGTSVEIEALSVTENGTYSEEGKAYSPVTVNVEGGGGGGDFLTVTLAWNNSASRLNIVEPASDILTAINAGKGIKFVYTQEIATQMAAEDWPLGVIGGEYIATEYQLYDDALNAAKFSISPFPYNYTLPPEADPVDLTYDMEDSGNGYLGVGYY